MATYYFTVSITWNNVGDGTDGTGSNAAQPDLTNSGSVLYVVSTGTTQSQANTNISGTTTGLTTFVHPGSSATTFAVTSTAATCYVAIAALRPYCSYIPGSGIRVYSTGTPTSISGPIVYNRAPAKMYLRSGYAAALFNYSSTYLLASTTSRPSYMKTIYQNPHLTNYTDPAGTNISITGQLGNMSNSVFTSKYVFSPSGTNRYIAINNLYYGANCKVGAITAVTQISIPVEIYIPTGSGTGTATIFIGPYSTGSSPYAYQTVTYGNSTPTSWSGTFTFTVAMASTVYLGFNVSSNPSSWPLSVVFYSYTNQTTSTNCTVSVDESVLRQYNNNHTLYCYMGS